MEVIETFEEGVVDLAWGAGDTIPGTNCGAVVQEREGWDGPTTAAVNPSETNCTPTCILYQYCNSAEGKQS